MKINPPGSYAKFLVATFGFLMLLLAICPHRAAAQTNTFPASGNAGVGTTSPQAKVHIAVDNYESVWFDRSANTGSTTLFSMGITYDTPGNEYFRIGHRSGGVGLHDFALSKTGNVGIGTTNPIFDANTTKFFALDGGGVFGSVGVGGNITSTANPVGQFAFFNSALAGSEKRVATIVGSTDGATNNGRIDFWLTNGGAFGSVAKMTVLGNGNVGIGIANPATKLHVVGDGTVTGSLTVSGNINAKYQDVAEWVPASRLLAAGTVVTLDPTKSNHVEASSRAYDTRVAGVISAQPGITLGESGDNKVLVATTGRVKVMVDAASGPIQVGDLLVTSDIEGVAKKSAPLLLGGVPIHRPGTLIGKALEPLAKGRGQILVLLSLQ
ncbi:MAG TPA: hypothetical protein DC047_11175 [Blastocatellia bacterium]|nr:hypothetical protein [Blastocatellia bacterium]